VSRLDQKSAALEITSRPERELAWAAKKTKPGARPGFGKTLQCLVCCESIVVTLLV
jgi:hypothetical protein